MPRNAATGSLSSKQTPRLWCGTAGRKRGDRGRGTASGALLEVAGIGRRLVAHPVTQAQWKTVMQTEPSHFKGPNKPVEQVSYSDCQKFCTKLTKSQKGHACVRLPTEAEWECA